ncbi:MAG: hypothetical protein ABIF19_19495 [Planctomycetota bacterium]
MEWKSLEWKNLCSESIEDLPDKPGAYAIRIVMNGKAKKIPRVFDEDTSGILCFGMTQKLGLKERIKRFYKAAHGESFQHAEGNRYNELGYDNARFSLRKLEFGSKVCEDEKLAKEIELDWFGEYERIFGELPPLNRKKG